MTGRKQQTSSVSTRSAASSLGKSVINWMSRALYVPEGRWIGTPLLLANWQAQELIRIYDNPAVTRRAILSFGRKNGKTTLAASVVLAHLAGPLRRASQQIYSTAQSRDQAALIYKLAAKMVRLSPILSEALILKDGSKEIIFRELDSSYRALSAEASTAYGLSPSLVVHDELGQVRGPRYELYEALETATGAQQAPLSLIISTQAATDADLLSVLIDDALAGHDPRVICRLYTAPMDADPFALETIRLANPAVGNFLNPAEVMAMAADAKRMPAREPQYRNLILNQRVEASSPFVTPMQWKGCGEPPMDLEGRDVYCGLDLSETADLTALVLIGVDSSNGCWHVQPTFWLPGEGLADRAQKDRVPYDTWQAQGFLQTTPGASVDYDFVARHLFELTRRHRVVKIGFDRWNFRHLRPWLLQAGFNEQAIKELFVEVGMGYQTMSPAMRDLQSLILDRKLRHGNHPVLSMCAANSIVESDAAGNRKLSKKRASGRIDGMVALLVALATAPLNRPAFDAAAMIG
jgi:phage terminase large subunit-like protein